MENVLTFRQYVNQRQRETAREYGITIKEVAEAQGDAFYRPEYYDYVFGLAKNEATRFSKRFLDKFHELYGNYALYLMNKWHGHVFPEYYVLPQCRD